MNLFDKVSEGPIIGRWPAASISAPKSLVPGDSVVIDNGVIRKAEFWEYGVALPEGAYIVGSSLEVPAWWWKMHFGELLKDLPITKCCGEARDPCPSREQCADCPELGLPVDHPIEE